MRKLPDLVFLSPISMLTADQDKLLQKFADKLWDGTTKDELKAMIYAGQVLALGAPKGLVLFEIMHHTAGRELHVYGVVGAGMIAKAREILADSLTLMKFFDCTMLGGDAVSRGMARVLEHAGFGKVSTRYLMEPQNG